MEATKIFIANAQQTVFYSTYLRMNYLSKPITVLINKTSQLFSGRVKHGACCYAGRQMYSQLHITVSPYPADGILSAFVVIIIISFSISSGSGLNIINYQHSSKLCPLCVIDKKKCDLTSTNNT